MADSWYSIQINNAANTNQVFSGYFRVNCNNIVEAFYETDCGTTNFNNNILAPAVFNSNDSNNFTYTADNTYINPAWSREGTNITSTVLQTAYPGTPNFRLRRNANGMVNWLWRYDFATAAGNTTSNGILLTSNIILSPLPADPSCFNEGTKILCLNKNLEEEYIPIENLRKGDLVKSYKHGYRKINLIGKNPMVNNPNVYNECMYKMEKTDDNGLLEDLIVTGGHSILVDDLGICKEENDKIFGTTPTIDGKYLLLCSISKDFTKLDNINLYIYYHFVLENNGNDDERFGVWANGLLTETPSTTYFINHNYTLL